MPIINNFGDAVCAVRSASEPWIVEIDAEGAAMRVNQGKLLAQTNAVARGLLGRGLKRGARVAILSENSANFLIAYIGIMRAGMCAVPINYRLGQEARQHIFMDAEIALVLADTLRSGSVPDTIPKVLIDAEDEWNGLLDCGPFTPMEMRDDEFANLLYTSGSTGVPKGVPITHQTGLFTLNAYLEDPPLPWDERLLVAAPLYHMNGLFFSLIATAAGAVLVLMRRFSAPGYLRAIASERCTYVTSIPTMIALAMRETDLVQSLDFSSVRTLLMGSAPLSADLMKHTQQAFPSARLVNGYGTTESGPLAFAPHPDGRPTPWPSLGVRSPKVELKLVGEKIRDEGTLWVRSKMVMPGYLNLPEKSAEKLHGGWYDTGDVMRRDADGFYYFVGRADDMFNCGGENVYPGEVEKLLETHPDIAQAAVVPVPDQIKGFLPAAFIVLRPGVSLAEEEVKAHALANGPAYQHPRFIRFVDALPLSGTNKIDRTALTKKAAALSRDELRGEP